MDYKAFMDLWNQAKPLAGYFDGNDPRLSELRGKVQVLSLSETLQHRIAALTDEVQILAFSEPWCPDCVINLTVLEIMAEKSPRMTVRILGREGHEDRIASYNVERKAYIPTFLVFVNGHLNGIFVERPEQLKQRLLEGDQKDRILCMQAYRDGAYGDATAEELLEYIHLKR